MNPTSIAWAMIRRHPATTTIFVVVIAIAVALGIGISAQERSLREGSAMAADRFDILVAARGSATEILLNSVFLRPSAVQLIDPPTVAKVFADSRAEYVAPIGYGDNVSGLQVMGTIAQFVNRLSDGLSEGRMFTSTTEAVIGAAVPFKIGQVVTPLHGSAAFANAAGQTQAGHKPYNLTIVGRMKPTGNPWDRAIVVPIETLWAAHGFSLGHAPGDTHIGLPFEAQFLPGLPAIVIKGKTRADSEAIVADYNKTPSMAFYPADALLTLYDVGGNVRALMSAMAVVSQGLAFLSIFAGVFALTKLFERQFAVLRALGASRSYVFLCVWLFASAIVVVGVAIGVGVGYCAAGYVTNVIARMTGISLSATLGQDEFMLAAVGAALGIALAILPAVMMYRGSVAQLLR
jgi:putative ABC transport system permease protein